MCTFYDKQINAKKYEWKFGSVQVLLVGECILNDRFQPPPMPIVQTIDGLQWGANENNLTYASLYQAMLLGKNLAPPRAIIRFPKCIH